MSEQPHATLPLAAWLRWIGLLPAALAGWVLAFFIALAMFGWLDSFCPPEEMVSGMCGASWYPLASQAVVCFGAGLSAFFVVGAAAWVAPSHRRVVAWVSFGVGASIAVLVGVVSGGGLIAELITALASGLLAVGLVHKLSR